MKSLKTLLNVATDEISDERDKAAVAALKFALRRVEEANDALEALQKSIDNGSFSPATGGVAFYNNSCSSGPVYTQNGVRIA